MANRFAKAASTATVAPKKGDGEIIIPSDPAIRKAIDDFVIAKEAIKTGESDKQVAGGVALPWIKREYLKVFATNGFKPDKFKVKGDQEEVLLLSQERSQYNITDEQLETLKAILGEKKAEQILVESTDFAFDSTILNKEGVIDILSAAIDRAVTEGKLTNEEGDKLLVSKPRRTIKVGTVDRLPIICDNDVDVMEQVADALGSTLTMYLR